MIKIFKITKITMYKTKIWSLTSTLQKVITKVKYILLNIKIHTQIYIYIYIDI